MNASEPQAPPGWSHQSGGRPGRIAMAAIAAGWAAAGILGLVAGQDLTQQVFAPAVAFAGAGLFASLAFGERGHRLDIGGGRLRWSWHPGRSVKADLALADLRELHRETEAPPVREGQAERRRAQQIFVVLADGARRKLPPAVLRHWEDFVRELRAAKPDLKVVERETAAFTDAAP
jgi:hypothetical protein